jgi:hypothetical protein
MHYFGDTSSCFPTFRHAQGLLLSDGKMQRSYGYLSADTLKVQQTLSKFSVFNNHTCLGRGRGNTDSMLGDDVLSGRRIGAPGVYIYPLIDLIGWSCVTRRSLRIDPG